MAERDPFHEGNASFVTAFPRGPQLLAAGLAAPLAVVWIAAIGSPLNLGALSGGWGAGIALMVAAIAVTTMLVAAVALVAADRLAEIKSRKAWAAIGVVADDLVTTPVIPAPDQRDDFCGPANTQALCAVLRAHRHAASSNALRLAVDIGSTDVGVGTTMSENAILATAGPIVFPISGAERTSSVIDVVTSRELGAADTAQTDAHEAFRARAPIGPTAIQGEPRQLKVMGVIRRVARGTRLAANDGPWAGWSSSDQTSTPRTVPIKIVSDIIIFGQGKRRQPGGEGPPCAVPGGSVPCTGVSARTSIVASTSPDRRQHSRAANKSLQPEVSFEAQRQLIALAEALARQAAREDDAEQIAERSRSPPDVVAGVPQGGSGGDDIS